MAAAAPGARSSRRSGSARVLTDRRLHTSCASRTPRQPDAALRPGCLTGPGVRRRSVNGCKPWYGENHFNDARTWWDRPTQGVPLDGPVVLRQATRARASASTRATTRGGACSPRPARRPARSATGRRRGDRQLRQHPTTTRASNFDCNYDGNYDGKPGNANGWLQQRRRFSSARRTRASSTCSSSRTRRARA